MSFAGVGERSSDSGIELYQMFSFRRRKPASPTSPEPNSTMLLGSGVVPAAAAADGEIFRRNGAYGVLIGNRRAAWGVASDATILIPVNRIAAGDSSVSQSQVVPLATYFRDVEVRHCDQVDVVAKVVYVTEIGRSGYCCWPYQSPQSFRSHSQDRNTGQY